MTCTGLLAGDDSDQYFTRYTVPFTAGDATFFATINVPGVFGNTLTTAWPAAAALGVAPAASTAPVADVATNATRDADRSEPNPHRTTPNA